MAEFIPVEGNEKARALFESMLNARSSVPPSAQETAARWDSRADEWERSGGALQTDHGRRAQDAAAFLISRGALGPESVAADIGCGPGRFACEFAKTARSVTGFDISPRMTELGAQRARELEIGNVSFRACDFHALDVRAEGLEGRFDLVFSSMTPAVRGVEGLKKTMAMSRAFCCQVTHVSSANELQSRIMRELFGRERSDPRYGSGQWFYALFNLLFLSGYSPEASYYNARDERRVPAGEGYARHFMDMLLPEGERTEGNLRRITAWLAAHAEADGCLLERSETCYGRLLWDVRARSPRIEFFRGLI